MAKPITRVAAAVITAIAAGVVWVIRHQAPIDRFAAACAELAGFGAIALLLCTLVGSVWALIPAAVYLLIQSVSLTRRGSR